MELKTLNPIISKILRNHKIDDLALEMELFAAISEWASGKAPERTAEQTKAEIAEALRKSGAQGDIRMLIQMTIVTKLNVNPGSKDGLDFIEHAYLRNKEGEDITTFANWWLANFDDPKYWSFKRMKEMWPRAFVKKKFPHHVTAKEDKWEQGEFVPGKK